MKLERATLSEQVGRAVNTTHLEHRAEREVDIDRVGALGAAALQIQHGADRRDAELHVLAVDPAARQDVLAGELVSILLHLREGGQEEILPRAIRTFTEWMTFRGRFDRYEDRAQLLPKLAARAMHEFLSNRCPRCGGTGLLEQTSGGTLVRGTGRMARNARFQPCPHKNGCGGTGKPAPSHTLRRQTLGLTHERYDAERWDSHVQAAVSWLERMQHRLKRPLTAQLERSTKRD